MEDISMQEASQGLFEGGTFTIIPNDISEDSLEELREQIAAACGTIIPFNPSLGRIEKLQEVTYIVSETSDFPDYYRALDLMIHVIKPSWVTASISTNKIKNPRTYSPDPALFMSNVVICCGAIPTGDKEAIEGGVLAMGGQISPILSKQVTHLIALDLSEERCQLAISKRLHLSIVLPHWFDDCLKVGRRISERPYTLPDPEILNVDAAPIPMVRTSQQIRDATSPDPIKDPIPPTTSAHLEPARAIKAFAGKNVKLGEDLNIGNKLGDTITSIIKAGGGDVVTKVEQADIYVCAFRDGADYVKASQDGKDVGNLGWLYYLITHNVWTNPMRRMMHYPRPRDGIPGFGNYKISISSYTGEARVYLENLIKATGAEFTKTFKQDNTHLIAAHKNSEKCEAAAEWGVMVLSHLWLEDSYAKCKGMPTTDDRYIYFPPRTNLGEVLGQTELDRDAMEKNFFSKTRKATKAAKAPAQPTAVPASSFGAIRVASEVSARSPPVVEKAKRIKSAGDAKTPVSRRHADKIENDTPGSRGAKDRALSKLHDAAPDIAKFEKEMKRKGGVVHGGRRRADEDTEDHSKTSKTQDSTSSKRSADDIEEDEESEAEIIEAPTKNKRAKKDKLTPIKFRMLVSKDDRWSNNDEKASKDKARLRELGLFITDDFKKVDILCAPKPVRTKKFVAALACAPALVSTSYLDYAIKNNKLPPLEKHPLDVQEFEEEYGFNMEESVARAEQNKHHLLRGWTIFCTEKIAGGFDTYKDIVEANGGKCAMWKGRTTSITGSKRPKTSTSEESQNQKEDEGDVLYLISDADKKDFGNWVKFRELAKKHDMVPRIVKTEWILCVAMAQYVHWNKAWELSEDIVKASK
ncbi:BRCT domain-containing protein [Phaeosphaeriaceae sp. PMI808]|nr:BRCT domain-containing protein [Phaeosphaeriaceae sp. PMI808]